MRTFCLAVLILRAAAVTLSAQDAGVNARRGDTMVYAHAGEITTLDPASLYDPVTQGLLANVYETLIRYRNSSLTELDPLLASKVPSTNNGLLSADGLTYRFPVRNAVKFQNGDALTPEDVRYSLLRFMFTEQPDGQASLLLEPVFGLASSRGPDGKPAVSKAEFENAVKVQGDSVVIRLRHSFAPFLPIMARWSYVTDKKWCVSQGEWDGSYETLQAIAGRPKEKSGLFTRANGTGPFRVVRWDAASKQVTLSSFTDYWGRVSRLKFAVMKTVPELSDRLKMLETGEADIIDLPWNYETQAAPLNGARIAENFARLATDPVFFFNFKVSAAANPDLGSGKLDGDGIPADFFGDGDVRKAFAYSFDQDVFLKDDLKGRAAAAKGSIPPGVFAFDPAVPYRKYSLAQAEDYFRKAYGGQVWEKGFRFVLSYNTGNDARRLACEALKKSVEAINPKFKIEVRGADRPAYLEKFRNKRLPLFAFGWTADYPDPHDLIFPFYHSKGYYPPAQGYSNPEMDKLVDAAAAEMNLTRRRELYARIQRLGYDETAQIYTVHLKGFYALRYQVKGFYDNASFMGVYFYPLSKFGQ